MRQKVGATDNNAPEVVPLRVKTKKKKKRRQRWRRSLWSREYFKISRAFYYEGEEDISSLMEEKAR